MFPIDKLSDAIPPDVVAPSRRYRPPGTAFFFGAHGMDRLSAWAEKRREQLLPTLTAMERGKMHTRELRDGHFTDTTLTMMEQYREWIAELDEIIASEAPSLSGHP